jgi:hypothetical protein
MADRLLRQGQLAGQVRLRNPARMGFCLPFH